MLAIVIPYYKRAFFEATLRSLAAQTSNLFRIYIGDDNSPENPEDLIAQYSAELDISYARFDDNLGSSSLTAQWARCLGLCRDESWVMILGDDDMLSDDCVAAFYARLETIRRQAIDVVRFATVIVDETGTPQTKIHTHPELESSADFVYRKETGQTRSSRGEYIFRAEKLAQGGFVDFPMAWHADDMAILQCSGFGNVLSINESVVLIRVSALSISGSQTNIEAKKKATFAYYSMLAFSYRSRFSAVQRRKIIGKVEQYFFRHKTAALFFKIARWHANNDVFGLFKFIRRTLRN